MLAYLLFSSNLVSIMESIYNTALIQKEDESEVIRMLKRTFFVDEPLNYAVGLCTEDDACLELEEHCVRTLLEGLSLKAMNRNGDIIGVLINGVVPLQPDDCGNDLISLAKRCRNPKFQKILYIMARREEGARLWERFPEDQVLMEVKVAATDPRWRRRGIMNILMKETEKVTIQRGIRLMRISTSSAYSARCAEARAFVCVYRTPYSDIKMDGRPLIVPDPPHVEDRVYVKKLH